MVRRIDPLLWLDQQAQLVLEDELVDAAEYLANAALISADETRAIALLAIHRIRISLPGVASVGGPIESMSDSSGSRSYKTDHLPAGYPIDLYRTSAGQQLIGIMQSTPAISTGCVL